MTRKLSLFIKFWIWPFIYIILIFALSSLSPPSFRKINILFVDKLLHLIEYGILGYLLMRALGATTRLGYSKLFLIILSIGCIIGFFDEYYQSFIPYRQSSYLDFIFDLAGIAAVMIIFKRRISYGRD